MGHIHEICQSILINGLARVQICATSVHNRTMDGNDQQLHTRLAWIRHRPRVQGKFGNVKGRAWGAGWSGG